MTQPDSIFLPTQTTLNCLHHITYTTNNKQLQQQPIVQSLADVTTIVSGFRVPNNQFNHRAIFLQLKTSNRILHVHFFINNLVML